MPIDHDPASVGYRRLPGLYEVLLAEQRVNVVKVDPRLSFDATDEVKVELAALAVEHPARSALLDGLELGEPVLISGRLLHRRVPADAPRWLTDGNGTVRVYPDDVVEPAEGPAHQCAW